MGDNRAFAIDHRTESVLVIQGADDPYGTTHQVDLIADGVRGPVERLLLPGIGHAPHLEATDEVVAAVVSFVARIAEAN
jgi:pimeloyl-ACP methyl ester carboxylesterase